MSIIRSASSSTRVLNLFHRQLIPEVIFHHPAGSCHENIHAFFDRGDLSLRTHAAINAGNPEVGVFRKLLGLSQYLYNELFGGTKDEGTRVGALADTLP